MAGELSKLWIVIGAKTDEMSKGLYNAQKELKKFNRQYADSLKTAGTALAAFGGTIIAAGIASAKSYTEMADSINNMAIKTGFSAKTLSELKYAADLTGTSIEGLQVGITRMQVVLADAASENKTAVKTLSDLGLTFKDLEELKPEDQFKKILIALSNIQDPAKRTAAAVDIFGKSGTNLLPMLENGEKGLNDFAQAAADAGLVLDDVSAKAGSDAAKAYTELEKSIEGARNAIAEALIPVLTDLINQLKPIIQSVREWIKENPALVEWIFKLGSVLVIAGTALYGIGSSIGIALKLMPLLHLAIQGITAVQWLWNIAMDANPIGLIIIGIGALIAAIYLLSTNWEWCLNTMRENWDKAMFFIFGPLLGLPAMIIKNWDAVAGFFSDFLSGGQKFEPVPNKSLSKIPSYASGGVVPGPIGEPVPIMAHGGEAFLGANGRAVGNTVIINLGVLPGDDVTIRKVARLIKDALGEDSRRNSFGQVNQGYFFGRSSV